MITKAHAHETLDTLIPLKGLIKPLLGIDVGSHSLGLALSDRSWSIASPLLTITRTKFSKDILILQEILKKHEVVGIVLGWPLNMDGSEGPRCQSVRDFALNLEKHASLPYAFFDERLSTWAVTQTMLNADLSRKRRDELVDKLAASYILQSALDKLSSMLKTTE